MALQRACMSALFIAILMVVSVSETAAAKAPPPKKKPSPPPPKKKSPPPHPPAPAPPCGMNNVCPADRWYCQTCRQLVPEPSCLQNWCFKCSSYPSQTFACQECITKQSIRGVQEWCLECIYQVNYATYQKDKTWACPQCASKAQTAQGMSDCIYCLKKAPAVNYWGCNQCMDNHATGSINLNFCLACTGKANDPNGCNKCAFQTDATVRNTCQTCLVKRKANIWGCGNCMDALPGNASVVQKNHCLNCVSSGYDENNCVTCAALGDSTVRDGCHTCMTKPSINTWGCSNCLSTLNGASAAQQNQCMACVGSGYEANGCSTCAGKATPAARDACIACLAKPGANVWACTTQL